MIETTDVDTENNNVTDKKVNTFVAITKRKIERVKTFASQMTSKLPPVVQKVLKSPITKVGLIGAAIAGVAHHSGYKKGSNDGFIKGYGRGVKDTVETHYRHQ